MQTLVQLINGELKGSRSLKISEGLTDFPRAVFELADTLEYLDLSSNKLSRLPHDFGRLRKLKIFFASENLFTSLPEVLADCPDLDLVGFKSNQIDFIPPNALNKNLRWLILTNNRLTTLPKEIGNCLRMQKLMLSGNRLTTLPVELSGCKNLTLLRIAANSLNSLPDWLIAMPALSWIAFSGNSFANVRQQRVVPLLDFRSFEVNEKLGEGASGVIYKAKDISGKIAEEVAIKIFKGSVTSDGFPGDEISAYIEAGNHDGLVRLIGKIELPERKETGLVMKLIPEGYSNLGLPPSFASCTRDVFEENIELSIHKLVKVALTIASVSEQLHSKGIIHGDLYAHNILINNDGDTLFGDFGAASFYDKSISSARIIERIEVRAFGYLLDDLLSITTSDQNSEEQYVIKSIRDSCLSPEIDDRPDFAEITYRLKALVN